MRLVDASIDAGWRSRRDRRIRPAPCDICHFKLLPPLPVVTVESNGIDLGEAFDMVSLLGLWDHAGRRIAIGGSRCPWHPGWFDLSGYEWRRDRAATVEQGASLLIELASARDCERLCLLMAMGERFELATLHAIPAGELQQIIDLRRAVLTDLVRRAENGAACFTLTFESASVSYKDSVPSEGEPQPHAVLPPALAAPGRLTAAPLLRN